jgi:hypothetical protein
MNYSDTLNIFADVPTLFADRSARNQLICLRNKYSYLKFSRVAKYFSDVLSTYQDIELPPINIKELIKTSRHYTKSVKTIIDKDSIINIPTLTALIDISQCDPKLRKTISEYRKKKYLEGDVYISPLDIVSPKMFYYAQNQCEAPDILAILIHLILSINAYSREKETIKKSLDRR